MKRVLLLVAPKNFRDEELFVTKKALEEEGFGVDIASTQKGEAVGMLGGKVNVEILVGGVDAGEYAGVGFVGGIGVEEFGFPENAQVLRLAKEAHEKGKAVGAICIAPRILASANLVRGKKVTSFSDEKTKNSLVSAGAIHTDSPVEADGKLITAQGPKAAYSFGKRIAQALSSS